jgi:hypothetical protein
MKPITIIVAIGLIVLAVFYFTKPSDDACRTEAMKIVSADIAKVPGYSDPNATAALPAVPQADKFLITDRFLWKDISYVYPTTVKKIGKGYLGSFHPSQSSN